MVGAVQPHRGHSRRTVLAVLVAGIVLGAIVTPSVAAGAGGVGVTFVQSPITVDTTWTPAGGPYRLVRDVAVEDGATLTIAPGTHVQLAENVTLTVRGRLFANGTAANAVTVSRTPGAPVVARWTTIRYAGGADGVLALHNVTVTGAVDGITLASDRGRVAVVDSTLADLAGSGVTTGGVPATPATTVENVTVQNAGSHGLVLAPGFGAAGAVTIRAADDRPHEATTHTVTIDPGVPVTADELVLDYRGEGSVAGVRADRIVRIGIDTNGDGSIERSLARDVASVGTAGDRIDLRFDRPIDVPGGQHLLVAYKGVTNPSTDGVYPVGVKLRDRGVAQLGPGVLAPLSVGGVSIADTAIRSAGDTRVGGLTITDTTVEDVGGAGILLDADRVTGLRLVNDRVHRVGGDAVSIRARRFAGHLWYDRLAGGADGLHLAVRVRATLDAYGNRIEDSGNGVAIRQSGPPAIGALALTLRHNDLSRNARDGLSVVAPNAELAGFRIANNSVDGNGGDGIRLSPRSVGPGTIADNRLDGDGGTGIGIDGRSVRGVQVLRNVVRDPGGDGVAVRADFGVRDVTVANDTVSGAGGNGLVVHTGIAADRLSVIDDRFTNAAGAGVAITSPLTHGGTVTVANDTIAGNWYGVVVVGALHAILSHDEIVYNTNAHAAPKPIDGVEPGTGIYVAEGSAGVVLAPGPARTSLDRLVTDPTVRRHLRMTVVEPDTALILRRDAASYAKLHAAATLDVRSVSAAIPTGVALPKAGDASGIAIHGNDVYGQPRGLTVAIDPLIDANTADRLLMAPLRTVAADDNYWGAASGPYHRSILPSGGGDAVVTRSGWVDFVPFANASIGPRFRRPTPRIDAPATGRPGDTLTVSGAASNGSEPIARYYFTVDGTAQPARSRPTLALAMPNRSVTVGLAVEDRLGIDGAAATSVTVGPARPTTTTAPSTSTTTPTTSGPTATTTGGAPAKPATLGSSLGSIPGLLGSGAYVAALLSGAAGMVETLRNRDPPIGGLPIHGLAGFAVLVWIGAGLLGTGHLLVVGVGAGVAWTALTGVAYLLVSR